MRSACCARAASGQTAAEPAIAVMKSRRLIAAPEAPVVVQNLNRRPINRRSFLREINWVNAAARHVRFGPKADICGRKVCPLTTSSGHHQSFNQLIGASDELGRAGIGFEPKLADWCAA